MIGRTISHYKILEKLGEGGMGVVYKAQDTKLDRMVALKFLSKQLLCDEEAKTRFVHEAKAASALNHPNITTIYEIDEVEGECFICMEYIEGKSLKELMEEKQIDGWDMGKIIDVGIQIAEGLSKAHQKGIVHRDIKSDNIMLTDEGVVKIMDFGLAKLKGVTKLTRTGTTLGTMQYMSPEQAQGMEVDQRSDIFSFGVVLYEMITGQLPFTGEHEAAVVYSIVNETPEPLARYKANVPEGLQRIVDKALKKDVSTRYQSAAEAIADLKGLLKETGVGVLAKPKKRLLPFLVPGSVVFILILLFLILKPFQVEILPERKAVGKENRLAIMYFDNLVDPEDTQRLGEIATNLLITDLSESQYLDVVSSQRLYDILKLLGREGEKKIDPDVATQVATKARSRWMLLGNILQIEPQIVITSQLVEVESGSAIASQRITGEADDNIFALVDKLTVEIKKDLSLPAVAQQEPDPSVADVTTHSPEAYRYYLEGVEYYDKYYRTEAEKSFRKALEFDSTFAMAYYWLSACPGSEPEEMIAKAVKYSGKATRKEKSYIKNLEAQIAGDFKQAAIELQDLLERYPDDKYANFVLGLVYENLSKPQEAIQQLNKVIELDPFFKRAYDNLAYVYNEIGDFEKAIWAINKYISLAPDEAGPYVSRGEFYASNGKIDQAIESFKKALEIKPGHSWSLMYLGHMYLFQRDYAKAKSCYQEVASDSDKDTRSWGRVCLAYIPLYQVKFEEALKVLDDGIAADRMEQAEGWRNARKHYLKAVIYKEKKNLNLALKEVEKFMEIYHKVHSYKGNGRRFYVRLLAENNDLKKAEEVASALKSDIEEEDETMMWRYWYAAGCIESSKGNLEASVANFERLVEAYPDFSTWFLLAKAYLASGRLGEAVAEFEKALSRYDYERADETISAVKAYYLLGLAYEKSGWNKKAIEQYEEFLEIWKDADPGIPEVEDAKERLAKLKGKA